MARTNRERVAPSRRPRPAWPKWTTPAELAQWEREEFSVVVRDLREPACRARRYLSPGAVRVERCLFLDEEMADE